LIVLSKRNHAGENEKRKKEMKWKYNNVMDEERGKVTCAWERRRNDNEFQNNTRNELTLTRKK